MAEVKKQVLSAAVPISIQEGGRALSLPERIRRTFEMGVNNAELSIMFIAREAQKPTESLREIPKWLWKMDKEIADEFGGKITVHAPEDISIESPSSRSQTMAADMIKHSLEVADVMKSGTVTVHATGTQGWALTNPISGTVEQLPAHVSMPEPLWRKVKQDLLDQGHQTVADRLQNDRQLSRNSHLLQWRQAMWMQKDEQRVQEKFRETDWQAYNTVNNSALSRDEMKNRLEEIQNEIQRTNPRILEHIVDNARRNAKIENFVFTNPDDIRKLNEWEAETLKKDAPTKNLKDFKRDNLNEARRGLALVDDTIPFEKARETFFETWKFDLDEETKTKIEKAMDSPEGIKNLDAKDMEKMFDPLIDNIKDTFTLLFQDKAAVELLNKGETKLCIENIYGPNFATGATGGYPMGWSPEHMKKIIDAIREVAKKNNVDPNAIGMTFDTQHAIVGPGEALGGTTDLNDWFNKFKEMGLKIDHAHLVGGHKGSHDTWGHVGLGDVVDEVMREHPDVIERLAEAGAINFEPGQGGVADIEKSLETVLHGGTPAMAMAAEGGAEGGAAMMGYNKKEGSFYAGQYNTHRASVVRGQFYSFSNPMERSSWQFAMNNSWYGVPSQTTPGAVTGDPTRLQRTWSTYQPY